MTDQDHISSPQPTIRRYRWILGAIVLAALSVRLVLAPQTKLEHQGDMELWRIWGYYGKQGGVVDMYRHPPGPPQYPFILQPNYLPPYLYVLWTSETIRRWVVPGNQTGPTSSLIYKIPAMLFDGATVLLLAWIIKRRSGERWALLGAGLYAFLPVAVIDSAVWGQIDAINTFFMVLTVWFMTQRRFALATMAFTIAFFFKMQSIILLPLLVMELARHHRQLIKSLGAGFGTAIVLNLPFLVTGQLVNVLGVIAGAVGSYQRLSLNAYNLWWLIGGGGQRIRSDLQTFLGLPLVLFGFALFFAAVGYVVWWRSQVKSADGLWVAAAFLALAFFMLPTEMHERYLFPFFALALPLLPTYKPIRWIWGVLGVTFTWNLVMVLMRSHQTNQLILPNQTGGGTAAMINLIVLAWFVWWVFRSRRKFA